MTRAIFFPPYEVLSAVLSANRTSAVTQISYQDNISYQCIVTGTCSGTFAVQGSLNYQPTPQGVQNDPAASGDWVTLGTLTVAGTDLLLFDVNQCAFPNIRIIYTDASSGTGSATCQVLVSGKKV